VGARTLWAVRNVIPRRLAVARDSQSKRRAKVSLHRVGVVAFISVENAFPPSVVKSKHGWRTAMHLEGRNEVENRNGACVMEVASLGSRAKMRAKEEEE
jgi:hypothetical protein